jgi:hypothetical protein
MAVTAAPTAPTRRNDKNSMEGSGTVLTAQTGLYLHTLVVRTKSGKLRKPGNVVSTRFMGIVLNASKVAGETCTFGYNFEVQIPITGVVVSNVGAMMCAIDNYKATVAVTGYAQIGVLTEFTSATAGYIWLRGPLFARTGA